MSWRWASGRASVLRRVSRAHQKSEINKWQSVVSGRELDRGGVLEPLDGVGGFGKRRTYGEQAPAGDHDGGMFTQRVLDAAGLIGLRDRQGCAVEVKRRPALHAA